MRDLLKEEKSANQLAAEHGLHPNQLYRWREIALAGLPSLFARDSAQEQAAKEAAHEQQIQELYAESGISLKTRSLSVLTTGDTIM